jgi:large subunit ribosomal protein L10
MRPEKISLLSETRDRLGRAKFAFLITCKGLSVELMTDLRGQMRQAGGRVMVVKNSFARKAAQDLGLQAPASVFEGSTAMACGDGDAAAAAKVLKAFGKDREAVRIKGGWLGAPAFLSPADVAALADIPARPVLYAMLAGTLAAPMTRLVGVLQQKTASIVYVLKAIEEKKGKQQ